ncbi:hypothetical protein L6452_28875 [Arctium lappa]|uniref:Uncharacterized protein n=1 Tax=Arctium lappa TaxID=4217 RepID=A0ACB9A0H5_ARCLA|nr:hypothetical protein L6452_28875 [Arctium lappa]
MGNDDVDGSKMVIKLKIPKLTAAAMEGERSSEIIGNLSSSKMAKKEDGKRVCLECNKEFSSGKALGGHMRIHVQNTFLKPSKTTKFKKDFNNGDHQVQQQQQRKPNYKNSVNDEGKPVCSLCGKIFPSMKSLFGHMRCHPERLWRGILPPPPNTPTTTAVSRRRNRNRNRNRNLNSNSSVSGSSSSSSLSETGLNVNYEEGSNILEDDDDGGHQVVDLTKFLRGWTVTERRGRRALKQPDEDEVLREAVEDLMSLAHGDHPPSSMAESDVTQKQLRPPEVFEGSNSNFLTNKDPKIDEKSKAVLVEEIVGKPVEKMEFEDGGNMIKNFSDNESDGRNTNEQMLITYKYKSNNPLCINPNKIKKRKKMKLMMELEQGFSPEVVGGGGGPIPPPEQPPESKYKCTTCNKTFTSHQALGGHRSSHNKSKITPTDNHHQVDQEVDYDSSVMNQISDNVEKEVEFAGDVMVGPPGIMNSNSGLHQCKICDKIFATGQALGGHKRCHWSGTIEAQAPNSSQVTSTGEGASQTDGGRRKILDFDLNEVPPAAMMEDEAGNGAGNVIGNGYASSSYNSNMG